MYEHILRRRAANSNSVGPVFSDLLSKVTGLSHMLDNNSHDGSFLLPLRFLAFYFVDLKRLYKLFSTTVTQNQALVASDSAVDDHLILGRTLLLPWSNVILPKWE